MKRYLGIIYAVVISVLFAVITLCTKNIIENKTVWYTVSSIQRLVFGIIATFIFCKIFNKKLSQVFCLKNWKIALIAGSGFFVYFLYYVVTLCLGIGGFVGLTMPLIILHLFLQQITTGFFEEITFRGLVLEGYFQQEHKDWKRRLLYAFGSFVLFGLMHIIDGSLYAFVFTGMIGFAFATIYLKSHNILVLMILHFAYDIFANLNSYIVYNKTNIFNGLNSIFYIVVGIMFVISIVILVREK